MSRLPYPISDSWTDAKPQIEELLRILYEERVGGLKTSSIIVNESDEARLSEGDANRHLVMNADADGHEWVNPYKIGTFTRAMDAASGDVSYTGIGFKPSSVIMFSYVASSCLSWGFDDGTNHYCTWLTGSTPDSQNTLSLLIYEASGKYQSGFIKTMDADGFTITWTRTGATAGGVNLEVYYIALR